MLLTERINEAFQMVESNRDNLPSGVLCRVKYPICNIGMLNANKRRYGKDLWERVRSNSVISEQMRNRALFGHAEHPSASQSDLQLTSHVIFEMVIDEKENRVYQMFDVLDTPTGRIVDCLLRANCKVGVSTRAEGELEESVDETGGKCYDVIADKYRYITTDFTADPSTFGALPIDIKRNVVESVNMVLLNERSKESEKKYATGILETISCHDKDPKEDCKCGKNGCGACDALTEKTVSVTTAPNSGLVSVAGDVAKVNVTQAPTDSTPSSIEVPVTVTVTTMDPVAPPVAPEPVVENPVDVDEPAVEDVDEPAVEDEDELGESKINERKDLNVNESGPYYLNRDDWNEKFWKNNYKVSVTEQGIEFMVNADHEQDAIDYVIDYCRDNLPGLLLTDEEVVEAEKDGTIENYISGGNEGSYLNTDIIRFEKMKTNECILNESEDVKKLYKAAGLPAPKGKGEHTMAFHKKAIAVAKSYVKRGDSPKEALKKAYPTAMKQLGKKKAVKKAHQKNESKSTNSEKSISSFVGVVNELKAREAYTRAERDKLAEEINKIPSGTLEIKMLQNRVRKMVESGNIEINALRRVLEEKSSKEAELINQVNEVRAELDKNLKIIEKITADSKRQIEESTIQIKTIKEDGERLLKERVAEATRRVVREYAVEQVKLFGSVHDNVRALLEDCVSIPEVDEVLSEYRESRRRGALHRQPKKLDESVKVKEEEPKLDGPVSRVGKVFEGFGNF